MGSGYWQAEVRCKFLSSSCHNNAYSQTAVRTETSDDLLAFFVYRIEFERRGRAPCFPSGALDPRLVRLHSPTEISSLYACVAQHSAISNEPVPMREFKDYTTSHTSAGCWRPGDANMAQDSRPSASERRPSTCGVRFGGQSCIASA